MNLPVLKKSAFLNLFFIQTQRYVELKEKALYQLF